jgi:hypothetical protein
MGHRHTVCLLFLSFLSNFIQGNSYELNRKTINKFSLFKKPQFGPFRCLTTPGHCPGDRIMM